MKNGGGSAHGAGVVVNGKRGRFMAAPGLTTKQRAFVAAYVRNGGNATAAAREAGYASPRTEGWTLIRNAAVIDAVRREFAVRVQAEAAAVGLAVLFEVAQDPAQSGAARVSAARALLQLAGHGGRDGANVDDGDGVSLSEMSHDRLVAVVVALESRVQHGRAVLPA